MDEPHSTTPLAIFSLNVRRGREERALTQEALARACSMTTSEISRIERGQREPRLATIVRLARALEVTPGDLFEGVEDTGEEPGRK